MGLKIGNPGKGGVVHAAIVHYTGKSLKKYFPDLKSLRVGVSSTLDGVQPDGLLAHAWRRKVSCSSLL
jgi:hypothetical protein